MPDLWAVVLRSKRAGQRTSDTKTTRAIDFISSRCDDEPCLNESTRFLYGICATAGLLIAGGIGFLMLQDTETDSDLRGKAISPIDDSISPTPPALPDAKKILEDEIAASKSEESELNSELKNLAGELETLRADTQSRKTEAEAMNRERSILVGESK